MPYSSLIKQPKYLILFIILTLSSQLSFAQQVIDIQGKPSRMCWYEFAPTLSDLIVDGTYLAITGFRFVEHPLLIITEGEIPNTEKVGILYEEISNPQTLPITLIVNFLMEDSTEVETDYTFDVLLLPKTEKVVSEVFIMTYNFSGNEESNNNKITFDLPEDYYTYLNAPTGLLPFISLDTIEQKLDFTLDALTDIGSQVLLFALCDIQSGACKDYYIGAEKLDLGLSFSPGLALTCKGFRFDISMHYHAAEFLINDSIITNPNRKLYAYCEIIQNNEIYQFQQREFLLPMDTDIVTATFAIDSTEVANSGVTDSPAILKFIVETKQKVRGAVATEEIDINTKCEGVFNPGDPVPTFFHLYPNPTNQNTIVTIPIYFNDKWLHMRVYNIMGKVVHNDVVLSTVNGIKWDLSQNNQLATGIYVIRVFDGGEQKFSEKILIR